MVLFFMKTGFFRARFRAVAALGALIVSFSVSAQDGAGTVALQEVVVTASRFARPIKEVLADVTVIDRQQIEESGATTVLQLLNGQPGVQVGGSTAGGDKVYIRGGEARMTGLFIDGVRVGGQDGNQLGGGVNWELIPLGDIERIEIVRGPSSVLYGADAMAGVVQIFTRKGQQGFFPTISIGGGSYNAQKVSAGARGGVGDWDYAMNIASSQSDGFDNYKTVKHTPSTEGSFNTDANLRLGYKVNDAHRVDVSSSQNRLQYRSVDVYGSNNYVDTTTSGTVQASGVTWAARWSDTLSSTARVTRSMTSAMSNTDPVWDYFTVLDGISADAQWKGLGGLWSPFIEQKKDTFSAAANAYNTAVSANRTVSATGLGYATTWGASEFQLNARRDADSDYGPNTTGALSYAYLLTPALRAGVSTGTSYRAPTLEQLRGYYGSTSLSSESSRSNEASLSYIQKGTEVRVVYYTNTYENLISSAVSSTSCSYGSNCWYNVNRASVEGVTLSGAHNLGPVRLTGSVDLLNPRNNVTGKYLTLRARQMMVLGAEMPWSDWVLGAEMQDVGASYDDATNTTVNRAYTLLNVRALYNVDKDWTLAMRINNATDQTYQQVSGYATPGCNFFVTLQWAPK
jgi:vitamin B12 transporter